MTPADDHDHLLRLTALVERLAAIAAQHTGWDSLRQIEAEAAGLYKAVHGPCEGEYPRPPKARRDRKAAEARALGEDANRTMGVDETLIDEDFGAK